MTDICKANSIILNTLYCVLLVYRPNKNALLYTIHMTSINYHRAVFWCINTTIIVRLHSELESLMASESYHRLLECGIRWPEWQLAPSSTIWWFYRAHNSKWHQAPNSKQVIIGPFCFTQSAFLSSWIICLYGCAIQFEKSSRIKTVFGRRSRCIISARTFSGKSNYVYLQPTNMQFQTSAISA